METVVSQSIVYTRTFVFLKLFIVLILITKHVTAGGL